MTIYRTERISADGAEGSIVPTELFGGDHWRLLLLVDDAAEDGGHLNPAHLRISTVKRPAFSPNLRHPGEHPTQVKASAALRGNGSYGVAKLHGHDDIDCLEDLAEAGYIEVEGPTIGPDDHFIAPDGTEVLDAEGNPVNPYASPEELEAVMFDCALWALTREGARTAEALRAHRDSGKTLHSFVAAPSQLAAVVPTSRGAHSDSAAA